jgi:hypothetical protein
VIKETQTAEKPQEEEVKTEETKEEEVKTEEAKDEEDVVVSDAFLNLENKQPTYAEKTTEDDEATEVKEGKLPEDNDEDEFERDDEDDEMENAGEAVDEDSGISGKQVNKIEMKVNINVTNINATKGRNGATQPDEPEKTMHMDTKLLDLLFSFIGATSNEEEEVMDTQRDLNLFSDRSSTPSRQTAGTCTMMPGSNPYSNTEEVN